MNILVLGSGGIGQAVIRRFCKLQGNIIYYTYTYWNEEMAELDKYIIDSGNCPSGIQLVIGDVRDNDWRKELKSQLPIFPVIDCFVNCVGMLKDRTLAKMSDEELYDVINVNLLGTINSCRVVLPHVRDGGSIITISSIIGELGNYGQSNYASAKAGIIAFTKSLAKELKNRKIRVNCILPSLVDTGIFDHLTGDQKKVLIDRTLMGRMATPEEVANLIYFVAVYGTYMNGDIIPITGGFY